ncbi:cell wall associated protein [Clostridium pasteurianum]|nr:cell wall associated protein [Clostridium pasteurianum]
MRTQKVVNGVTTNYHLEGDKVTYESNGTDKIYYTYDSEGDLISMNLSGTEYYYIRNVQGDIIGLFDKNGTQVVSYTYDTWGKLISTTGTLASTVGAKNPYRYRGYRYDGETGLYYLNARYYNAEWGRFINADAYGGNVGNLLSHNVFAYCMNNPVNMSDPSGQWGIPALLSVAARVVATVIATVATIVELPLIAVVGIAVVATAALVYEGVQLAKAISPKSSSSKSKAKTKAKTITNTNKKEQPTTKLYRAMDYVEYNRFTKSGGKFSNYAPERPNVMDTKWFATNSINAEKWGKALNPNGYKIIQITIPTKALNGMYYNPYLDGIGPAYNGTVPYMNAIIIDYGTVK